MSDVSAELKLARDHHQAGRVREAAEIAREILRNDPTQAAALYLLATIAYEKGKFDYAHACAQHAVTLEPENAAYHSMMGVILRSLGELDSAIASYQRSIRLAPDNASTYYNLGNALRELRRPIDAIHAYRRCLKLDPNDSLAYHNLARALVDVKQYDAAIDCFQKALHRNPGYVDARVDLGGVYQTLGQLDAAASCYVQALRYDPGCVAAHNNLGNVRNRQGKYESAVGCFRQALRVASGNAQVWNNLGNSLMKLQQYDEAQTCFDRAIGIQPDYAKAYYNRGNVHLEFRRVAEALQDFDRAIQCDPKFPEARVRRAHVHLMTGNWAQGWPDYAWRWKVASPAAPRAQLSGPRWDGSPLDGQTIVLHCEQGIGDTIQFVRFAPAVKQRGGTVILVCPRPLVDLLSHCPGIDQCIPFDQTLPAYDVHAWLSSLPEILETTPQTIPGEIPYIRPDAQRVDRWREKLSPADCLQVGIAWQGGPVQGPDCGQSIPRAHFSRLAQVAGVRLIGLHPGAETGPLDGQPPAFPWTELDLEPNDSDGALADRAAVMAHLDLVVTSDNAVAHLAGALGTRVWVALTYMPDWRWQLDRSDCPWYPTMRLFRQSTRGDWDGPFQQMQSALEQLVDTRAQAPPGE